MIPPLFLKPARAAPVEFTLCAARGTREHRVRGKLSAAGASCTPSRRVK